MDSTTNTLNWFELPTKDIKRAVKFYSAIFGIEMEVQPMGELQMAFFPFEPGSGKLSGSLVQHEMYEPSDKKGPLMYFNGNPNLQPVLDKVEKAGGKIVVPKTQITEEHGYMAVFLDSEGNRVALHSQE